MTISHSPLQSLGTHRIPDSAAELPSGVRTAIATAGMPTPGGEVIIVRWADDFIVGFEQEQDARQFLTESRGRFARFWLELHPYKTRLIEFGRNADWMRRSRGAGKPETFDFWA
jgi:hypothetical protein